MSETSEAIFISPEHFVGDPVFGNTLLLISLKELELPITISMGGTLITGTLIGEKEYFYLLGPTLTTGKSDFDKQFQKMWERIGDKYLENLKSAYENKRGIRGALEYFHLKDASFIFQNSLTPTPGLLWRGTCSEIDGWSQTRLEMKR